MSAQRDTGAKRAQSPQSVTRVIRLLEALCASADPLSLAELSRLLDTPKSSLAALLRGLAEEDFVTPVEGAWRLGPGAFGLGSALTEARRRFQSSDLIRDAMHRLSERSGETVLFAVRDAGDDMLTYVDIVESRNSVRFSSAIGDRRPLYLTAGGRALLSADNDEAVAAYLASIKPDAMTKATITDKREIAAQIAEARTSGVAQTIDQAGEGVTGNAAVIRDASGRAIGALVLAAPSQRSQDRLDELTRLVSEEALAISRSFGFR